MREAATRCIDKQINDPDTGKEYGECDDCIGLCGANLPLLSGVPMDRKRKLIRESVHIRCPKDTYLFHQGEPASSIWIICEGRVKLSKFDADGREQIAGIFSDYDAIWEGGGDSENSTYPYSAICTTNVVACEVCFSDFQKLLEDAEVSMNIVGVLSRKLHDANERNLILATKDPKAKIAGMLLYHGERSMGLLIELKLEDIAASLNLRMETVSRKIREMEQDGLVERVGRGKIRILNMDLLKEQYEE